MKTKLILWGKTEQDQKVLVAIELLENENKVKTYVFSEEVATEEFYNLMLNEWRFDRDIDFPAVMQTYETSLTASEDILPEGLLVEKPDLINRAKTEWHFVVLSKKLYDLYKDELEDIKDQISELNEFSSINGMNLKYSGKSSRSHVKRKEIYLEIIFESLKRTDELFNNLKELRNKSDDELKVNSEKYYNEFNSKHDEMNNKN
ncbi:MAG: hypothetical protein R2771_12560 [Saprospiraceae bacterium]